MHAAAERRSRHVVSAVQWLKRNRSHHGGASHRRVGAGAGGLVAGPESHQNNVSLQICRD